jgi:nicotinamidase/pyrazinamidase
MGDGLSGVDFDARTALIVVDVQNDFSDPEGNLYVQDGEKVVPTINRLVDSARDAGAVVFYTQDWHPEKTPHFKEYGGIWPVHCVQGTWGSQLHPELQVSGPIIRKGTGGEDGYSAFTVRDVTTREDQPTELEAALRKRGIARLVIVGLAQDVCVKETALDARRLGFDTIVLLDATRPVNVNPGDDRSAQVAMTEAGAELR